MFSWDNSGTKSEFELFFFCRFNVLTLPSLITRIQMPRDVQSFNRSPAQIAFNVWRKLPFTETEPFKNSTDEDACNQLSKQSSMPPAKARKLLPEQKLSFRENAESAIGPAITNNFLTAENSHCIGISEDAKNDPGAAFGRLLEHLRHSGIATHSLSLIAHPRG